jgi:uncharacterized membrane protein YcaP (DUF421 family)
METQVLLMTAVRAVGVYVLVLIVIRLMGKRAVGNFSAFDLLVALMIGEIVDEMIYGDVTFLQGAIPIVVIAVLHEVNAWLSYYGHGLDRLLEGRPSVVVKNGEFERKGMRDERMNEHDVMSQLRLQGIDDLREVKVAAVETDGIMSVIRQEWAEPLQKADLGGKLAEQKEAVTKGKEEPSPRKQTASPDALGQKE